MKILFFNYEYPPLGGGAANATKYILKEYSKFPNFEVDLITSSFDKQFHIEEVGKNVRIHKLPIGKNEKNIHFQSQKDLLVYAWKAYFYSKELIKSKNHDLTHSFFTVPCGFISLLFKMEYKLPYIVSLRGSDVPGYSERFTLIYKFLTPIIKSIWSKADFVVSNSQGLKELALESKKDQAIDIIFNGVDIDEFQPSQNQSKENFTAVCISRLTPRKGINYLIKAVKKLSSEYPKLKLKIVGEGNAKAGLEKQAEELQILDKVEFTGPIDHAKLPPIYNSASVFVLPSLNEGMSNTLLEALASGLPVLMTPTGGAEELVKNEKNGFIIKMQDSNDIAEKLKVMINNPNLKEKMALESRKLAEKMSWKNIAKQYFDLYLKLKNKKSVNKL